MTKIVNVELCSGGHPSSGGEKCFTELVKQFRELGYKQETFLGWRSHKRCEVYKQKGNKIDFILSTKPKTNYKSLVLLAYIRVFFASLLKIKRFRNKKIIIISHSDAWPNMIFSLLLKIFNSGSKWASFNHMLTPDNKFNKNSLLIKLYNYLNQGIYFILQKKSDLLITVNEMYLEKISRYNPNHVIVNLGAEKHFDRIRPYNERDIDISFMGRFYPQKGISEIQKIVKELSIILAENEDKLKIFFIGKINEEAKKLKSNLEIYSKKFEFHFTGFKTGDEKFQLLSRSKVFLFPSLFESFGIVYLDAISVGTPVVEYDLKEFLGHKFGVLKVPYLNNRTFAKKLLSVVNNKKVFDVLSKNGWSYSREFTWKNTAKSILEKLEKVK